MNLQAVLQLITSLAAALGINAIPAGIVLIGGSSGETVLVLYFLETLASVILAAARVRILAPAGDEAYADMGTNIIRTTVNGFTNSERQVPCTRRILITNYVFMALAFMLGVGVFIFALVFLVGHANIPGSVILSGMEGIVALQVLYFVADLGLLHSLTPPQAENLLQQSMGRVALIFLGVFIGIFLAAININWFVVPFIALRTMSDVAVAIQNFAARIRKLVPAT